jgi:hypothetical protein
MYGHERKDYISQLSPKTYFTYPGYDVPFQRLRLLLYRAVVNSKKELTKRARKANKRAV